MKEIGNTQPCSSHAALHQKLSPPARSSLDSAARALFFSAASYSKITCNTLFPPPSRQIIRLTCRDVDDSGDNMGKERSCCTISR